MGNDDVLWTLLGAFVGLMVGLMVGTTMIKLSYTPNALLLKNETAYYDTMTGELTLINIPELMKQQEVP